MGWTGSFPTEFKNGKLNKKAEIDSYYTYQNSTRNVSVVKSVLKGNVYYGAIKVHELNANAQEDQVIGIVVLTKYRNGEFLTKSIEETCGPFYFDCPQSVLEALTYTDNKNAIEWRKKCWSRLNNKKTSPNKLPIGTRIKFEHQGKTIVLEKQSPSHQFKTPWWLRTDKYGYWPKKYIPDQYEIVNG